MKKRVISILAVFALVISLFGCGKTQKSAEAVLGEILAVGDFGGGIIYRSGAAEGEVGYASPALLALLFGRESAERDLPLVSSFAIYSSGRMEISEVSVFRVYSAADTRRIAEMCHKRAHAMQAYLQTANSGVTVAVVVRGHYVIMIAAKGAEDLARRLPH